MECLRKVLEYWLKKELLKKEEGNPLLADKVAREHPVPATTGGATLHPVPVTTEGATPYPLPATPANT